MQKRPPTANNLENLQSSPLGVKVDGVEDEAAPDRVRLRSECSLYVGIFQKIKSVKKT